MLIDLGYDRSDQRRADMRSQAERAVKLAPDSIESQLANAWYLTEQQSSLPAGEQALAALVKRAPGDWRPLLLLGQAAEWLGRPDESIGWYDRAAAIPAGAAIAKLDEATYLFNVGRFDEAEKAMDKSIAIRPLGRALLLKLRAQELWWGDLDGGKQTVERMPSALLLEDKGAFMAFRLWLWRREPDQALTVVRGLSHDFLEDEQFSGPKAILVAAAEKLAGRTDLARADWELALRQLDERLQANPNQPRLLYHRAHCLVELGRTAEADEAIRIYEQSSHYGPNMWPGGGPGGLLAELGHTTEALGYLEQQVSHGVPLFCSRAVLSLNPDFDSLRSDPRFQQILARAPGPARPAAPAAGPAPVESTGQSPISQLPPAPGPAAVDAKSVAVLAFTNLSDDKGNEYFSDGISEELLNVLAKIPGLKVTARTSAFYFKGKDLPIADIARQLGVAYIVEGSVRKQGDRVRISAELIKAADGFQAWSDQFDRNLKDIFAVQDEITGLIAGSLQVKLAAGLPKTNPVNPEAYNLVLQAHFFAQQESAEGRKQAANIYRQAIAIDPNYAQAWGDLARVYAMLGRFYGGLPMDQAMAEARAAAQSALKLNSDEPSGLNALGWVQRLADWDWSGARKSFLRAVALAPDDPTFAADAAVLLCNVGQIDQAIPLARRAVERDPLSARAYFSLGDILASSGHDKESVEVLSRGIELAPSSEVYRAVRACMLSRLHRFPEAEASVDQEPNEGYRLMARAIVAYDRGNQVSSAKARDELITKSGLSMAGWIAIVYAHQGQADQAFAWFDRAAQEHDRMIPWLKNYSLIANLHTDPRWPVFLHKIGLTDEQLK